MTDFPHKISMVNGVLGDSISLNDRGLAYGDGLFETLLWLNGEIPLLSLHLQRLSLGCARLLISADIPAIAADIERLSSVGRQHGLVKAALKIWLTRGVGGRGYSPCGADSPTVALQLNLLSDQSAYEQQGVELVLGERKIFPNPLLAGIKHLNRLDYVQAALMTPTLEGQQLLLVDEEGKLLETLHHNIFWVIEGKLYTPELKHAGVEGVMRRMILEDWAQTLGLDVTVSSFGIEQLGMATEVFICNSLRGIWPVHSLAAVNQLTGWTWAVPGPITQLLQRQFAALEPGAQTP
jgi:4-amino-4-deoxychorismate lyase